MPTITIHRALPCVIFLSLAACNPSSPPAPATIAPPPVPPSVGVTPAGTPGPAASTVPAIPASVANAMPSGTQPNLLDSSVATAKDTLDSLKQRYGASNIKDGDVPGAEGEELSGWILFPDDPKRRVYVYLDEAGTHPSLLRVLDGESQWRRGDGIHMGLTLTELVALNGKPIEFSGFGWDYGGAISDWHGGAMENQKGGGGLTMCPPDFPEGQYPDDYPSGDAQFSSGNDLVVRYPPVVCEFGVVLEDGPGNP